MNEKKIKKIERVLEGIDYVILTFFLSLVLLLITKIEIEKNSIFVLFLVGVITMILFHFVYVLNKIVDKTMDYFYENKKVKPTLKKATYILFQYIKDYYIKMFQNIRNLIKKIKKA